MRAQEQKEFEKMEKLREIIERSPLTQQIKAEKAAETLAKRQEAAGKLEALRKEQEEVIPKLREVVEDKEREYLKAQVALNVLLGEIQRARAELSSENNSFDTDIRQQETILFKTVDPIIDEAIEFFRSKLDDLRKPGRISSRGMDVNVNMFTEMKTLTTETNKGAVLGAIRYCMEAIKELEALKLSRKFNIEGIKKIKDEIPSIEVFEETSGEKPLPGSKGVNPRSLLPSDSEMDWKVGNLMEKFKRIMGR
jgi:hypothetical protein